MARFNVLLPTTLLLAGVELVGCGNGGPRRLQSVSVTPASADAQSFPNGQVQFTAVGTYSQPPSPAPIVPMGNGMGWSVSDLHIATINQSGLAQCKPGALGVVTVRDTACCAPCVGTECTAAFLVGNAKLSCP
jgi:hypothetical protein